MKWQLLIKVTVKIQKRSKDALSRYFWIEDFSFVFLSSTSINERMHFFSWNDIINRLSLKKKFESFIFTLLLFYKELIKNVFLSKVIPKNLVILFLIHFLNDDILKVMQIEKFLMARNWADCTHMFHSTNSKLPINESLKSALGFISDSTLD